MAAVRALVVVALCGLLCQSVAPRELLAMQTDRTLDTSGQTCLDRFDKVISKYYEGDSDCSKLIKQAMSGNTDQECPEGLGGSVAGLKVQKCLSKSQDSISAWGDFIKSCEVMNVNNRGGEAEAATDAKASCFPRFSSLDDFTAYLGGAKKSSAAAARLSIAGVLAAAAAAGAAALL